jgi:hypothetical protein
MFPAGKQERAMKRRGTRDRKANGVRGRTGFAAASVLMIGCAITGAWAQTDCSEGNGVLDMTPPKDMTAQELIQKFAAAETKAQEERNQYTYTQDVKVQTLNDKTVDGQFHEIATVSYDGKGKRTEKVTFAEQSTLRGVSLTQDDFEDIHVFMQWFLTQEEATQYKLTYAGQQHVDDLDTYVFHVEPKKEEKNKRYFQGRVWIDGHDFEVVKTCGKSVPDVIHVKKNQPMDIRPAFVSYRKFVDGQWFPAYARVDDTLQFKVQSVHLREIVKLTGYKKAGAPAGKP